MCEKLTTDNILQDSENVIASRKSEMPGGSYVAGLFKKGEDAILRKVTEEACELVLASKNRDSQNMIHEAADLLFHVLVTLGYHDIPIDDVFNELKKRFK